MTTTTKPRSLQRAYPPDFTHFIAEVADTTMKAIIEPDPVRYIQWAAVSSALELRRLRCDLAPERRRDPALAAAFRCDVVRNRVIRDLATQIIEAYERLGRAESTAPSIPMAPPRKGPHRKGADDPRGDHTSPFLASG